MNRSESAAIPEGESDYEKWFREKVEAALRAADDPNSAWTPHDVVQREMEQERIWLEALIAAGRTSSGNMEQDIMELKASGDWTDSAR